MIKRLAKSVLTGMGLEVRRLRHLHRDAIGDERALLAAGGGAPVTTVFDVGAYDGSAAQAYRAAFPQATVHCFEPSGSAFARIESRFAADPRVVPNHAAVGETAGTQTLHVNVSDQTNSLLPMAPTMKHHVNEGEDREVGTETVPVVTLDGYCAERGVAAIDLLKLDVQGSELRVLRGARRLVESHAVRLIFSEVLFGDFYVGQTYFHEIASFLAGYGYRVYGLYDLIQGKNGILAHADVLFASPEVWERVQA